ncbi:MAG: 2-hydroxyacid dehydrogenase [Alphaproteobacteria bacterium]
MPTIVIQNDHIIRALSVMLDPDCDPERIAGFADYYSVDMPEFPQWCEELRKKYPAVAPSRVVLTNSQEEFRAALPEADAVVIEEFIVGEEELALAPNLKIVQNFRTDMRNVDEEACAARKIPALPFHRTVNVAVGEHAFSLMMALAKKTVETNKLLTIEALQAEGWPAREYDRRHTANSNWARISGVKNMFGSTLGIVGLGSVGRYVANWANAFDMEVIYTQRNQLNSELENEFNARYVSLNDLFEQSDFVSIHVPLNDSTNGLIGAEQLDNAKPGIVIVNIARADIIQKDALLAALDSGQIGGVGMDVHYKEPGDDDDPFLPYKNVIMSPHIAIGSRVNGAVDMESMVSNISNGVSAS